MINIENSIINLEGLDLSKVTELNITSSFITGIKSIENLTNLRKLKIDTISNYEELDFGKFTNLNTLTLNGIFIEDFSTLFNNIPNVTSLNLNSTNLNNNNITDINKALNVRNFYCLYTTISNLDPFIGLQNLRNLYLPYTISDYSKISDLSNVTYIQFNSDVSPDKYPTIKEQLNSKGISYDFTLNTDNLSEEDSLHLDEEINELYDKYSSIDLPEQGTLEYIEYIMEYSKDFGEVYKKYVPNFEGNYLSYSVLDFMSLEHYIGYGIKINSNGKLSKALYQIIKFDNKYYYYLYDDNNLEEGQIFNSYDTFEGTRVSFISNNLYDYDTINVLDLKDYEVKSDYLVNIEENTSIEDVIANLGTKFNVKIVDVNHNHKTEGIIATGDIITISKNDIVLLELIAVVTGDSTGDGIVNMGDLNKLYYYIEHLISLEGPYYESCELVENNNVDIGDLNKLYYYVLGLINEL